MGVQKGLRAPVLPAGPPADYFDPDEKVPRLPMPYRMIDNVLRDLVEEALEQAREDPPREEPLVPVAPSFTLEVPDIVAVQPTRDGLMVFVGCRDGKVRCVNSLRGEPVGEPIDLEDSIKCMALAADGRLLAVAVGGSAGDDDGAEPKASTVKLMLVQPDKPFLKTVTSTTLSGEAKALSFSFDSCVFAAQLVTDQLECFRTTITAPPHHEDVEPASPQQVKAETGEGESVKEEQQEQLVTDPVRVLLTPTRPAPSPGARTVVMLGKSPKVRQVGELEANHCAYVNMVTLGSHFVEKFRVSESALPPPPEGEPVPVQQAEMSLRLPHAVTAVAMDASTALLFTGLRNGGSVLWNNVFGTQMFALRRHKATVTAAAFTKYEQRGETPLLITAADDAVVHIHDTKDGSLKASFQKAEQVPRVLQIHPTPIPLVLLQGDMGGGAGDVGAGLVQVFSLEDFTSKGFFELPRPYMPGAVRARLELPTVAGELGEMAGVVIQELPPPKPPPVEGAEAEPEAEVPEGEEDPKKGKCKLVAFRLIDMLALAFANMVKTQYGSWIQTSAKETYWSQAGVGLARTAGNAVSDRYLRDAAGATSMRFAGSPRNLARQGTGLSPRRTSMNSPGRASPLMGASRGATSPLAAAVAEGGGGLRREESSSSLKGLRTPMATGAGGRAKTGGVVPSYSQEIGREMGNASPGLLDTPPRALPSPPAPLPATAILMLPAHLRKWQ